MTAFETGTKTKKGACFCCWCCSLLEPKQALPLLSLPSKVGGLAGDSRGIRWGFAGDSQAIRGIRLKNACFWFEFQGDSLETTNPFYNIK